MKKLLNPFILSGFLIFGPFVIMFGLTIVLSIVYSIAGLDTTGLGALSFMLIPIYMVTLPLAVLCFFYGVVRWLLKKD